MGAVDLQGLRVEWLPEDRALVALREQGPELLERAGAHGVFNGPDWLLAQRAAFDLPNERLWLLTVRRRDRLLGWLPLVVEAQREFGLLRRARLLGDGSFDSDYLEPLIDPDQGQGTAAALVRGLRAFRRADYAVLRSLPAESPGVGWFLEALKAARCPVRIEDRQAARTALPGDFESLLAGLKSRMRSKVRQAQRRAQEQGWSHESLPAGQDPKPWLEELFRLHQARWQAQGEAGAFGDARRVRLYREAFERLAAAGNARLDRLVGSEGTLAIQAGFTWRGTYHQLQEGYDPALGAQRPGIALRAEALRAAIQEGVRTYDFLGGFSGHKADWGAELVPLETLTLPLSSLAGSLAVRTLIWRQNRRPANAAAEGTSD